MPKNSPMQPRKRYAIPAAVILVVAAMASSLSEHGAPMLRAAGGLSIGFLGPALVLAIVYRANQRGGMGPDPQIPR